MFKIAIIDDGIIENDLFPINKNYEIKNNTIVETSYETKAKTHGSVCAHIFTKYAEYINYELICIKILNENRESDIENLIIALNWCNENNINIISLSIGSSNVSDYNLLNPIINKMISKNTAIIAACNNNNSITYPASMDGVIGVKCDISGELKAEQFIYYENDLRNIELTVGSLKSKEEFLKYNLGYNNSYVVPYISALIYNLLYKGISSLKDIAEYLKNMSNCKNIEFSFLQKSFPLLYKPNSLIIQVSGNDYNENIGIEILNEFLKRGYYAIIISQKITRTVDFCYSIEDNKIFTGISPYLIVDFIIKSTNPDVVIISLDTPIGNIPVDCSINVDNSINSELTKFHTGSVRTQENENQDAHLIGNFGQYAISVVGSAENADLSKATFYGDFSEDMKKSIIDSINLNNLENHTDKNDESEIVEINVNYEQIHSGAVIDKIEEIFN